MSANLDSKAPDFTLQNTKGNKISLSDYRNDKNVVLLFFPLAFTGTCTEELCTTRDNMKLYNSMNAEVLGISVDSFFVLKEFKKAQNLNFTLLSDFNKEVSKKYDVLYSDYYGMKGVSKRSAFIIDRVGIIRYKEVLDDSGELPDFKSLQQVLAKLN
ncbi:MAG: peroxiredoxin [Balneolaceae bacterium]|jgi:peroxiredoxin